jgi:Nucleotide modification associated domain 3
VKLIFSRKGFDAKYGGCASPIFENDAMVSLPIPAPSQINYGDIWYDGAPLARHVAALTRGRIGASHTAHLDPDLRRDAFARHRGWRALFGQSDAAASHLQRMGVGPGDLFLFFGWFRRVERAGDGLRYRRDEPDLHVIFGWMQVGAAFAVTDALAAKLPWAAYHPHLSDERARRVNTLYAASDRLDSLELDLPGAGVFPSFRSELCLTETRRYRGRSMWRLPRWLGYRTRSPLSRHGDRTRWRTRRDHVELRTVPVGQEFVLDLDWYPESRAWLRDLICGACPIGPRRNASG